MTVYRSHLLAALIAATLGTPAAAAEAPAPPGAKATLLPHAAAEALRQAATAGDPQAQYDYASALVCGQGLAGNASEAAKWFGLAAEQGHSRSMGVLGWMYMTGQGVPRDDRRALALLGAAAERGDTAAQNNLGVVYAQGRGVPVDRALAQKWFERAAEKGAVDARRNLEALLRGSGKTAQPGTPEFRT